MVKPEDVVAFWVDEVGPEGWYGGGAELDARVRDRFEAAWKEAQAGAFGLWLTSPQGTLGYIILTDQLPRNMFRDRAEAFATDASALAAAKMAIDRDWDQQISGSARQFFFLPMMHSEALSDQDLSVQLFSERMGAEAADNLRHARAHRRVIREFGRFPYRNTALGRETTAAERDWMENGGYGAALRAVGGEPAP